MQDSNVLPRIYGSEVEYGFAGVGTTLSMSDLQDTRGTKRVDGYLENGSRMYVDLGLPEYATPECKTLDDLVLHELAGEQLILSALRENSSVSALFKRSITPYGVRTTGAHESYLTSIDINDAEQGSYHLINALATHFATRTIFTGAGVVTTEGYKIGQKVHDLWLVLGETTTGEQKTLVNTRDEALGYEGKRLHVIAGDANISPWAIKAKFGTTSLLLRLLENGYGAKLSDLFLKDPLEAAKMIGSEPENMHKPLELLNGKRATAVQIQKKLVQKIMNLLVDISIPKEEISIGLEWIKVLDELAEYKDADDSEETLVRIDWLAKLRMIKAYQKKASNDDVLQQTKLDLL